MVRVLHVVPNMQAGGIETFLMNVYRNIDREKVQFDFLVHYKQKFFYDDEIEELGGKIYRFSVRNDWNFIKYVVGLIRFFHAHKEYTIVHGHMKSLAFVYLLIARIYGVRIRIAHSHGDSALRNIKGRIKWILFKLAKINANYRFACSNNAGNYLFGNEPFDIIKYPIETDRFVFSEETRREVREEMMSNHKTVIGHVGRFNLQKNHKFVVEIFNELLCLLPDAELWLIGNGELEQIIHKQVRSYGIGDKVRFLGVRADVNRLYQAMDLFLLPSLFEGMGIVNIEAQAADLEELMTDSLPEEAFITEKAHPMSLKKGADKWAEMAVTILRNNVGRRNRREDIRKAGYDISNTVMKLQSFYIDTCRTV